jgi:hypothetical protein
MLLPAYQSTGRQFPEDRNLNIHRRESMKSHVDKCSEPLFLSMMKRVT